jgi:hypothetical protein
MHDADPTAAHDVLDLDPMISRWPLGGPYDPSGPRERQREHQPITN